MNELNRQEEPFSLWIKEHPDSTSIYKETENIRRFVIVNGLSQILDFSLDMSLPKLDKELIMTEIIDHYVRTIKLRYPHYEVTIVPMVWNLKPQEVG